MSLPPASPTSTVVITGASSGIGTELARALAELGHHVTLVARGAERLEELAGELGAAGRESEVLPCDLAHPRERAQLIGRLEGSGRLVVGLCNNAGFGTSGRFAELPLERELEEVSLNVGAVHHLTGALLGPMVGRGSGAVLNVASIAGFQPMPGMATYAASKAFVISFSEALHTELRGSGVSCTVLCPGPTETEFSRTAGLADLEAAGRRVFASPADVARAGVRAMVAGRRIAFPRALDAGAAVAGRFSPRSVSLRVIGSATIGALRRAGR